MEKSNLSILTTLPLGTKDTVTLYGSLYVAYIPDSTASVIPSHQSPPRICWISCCLKIGSWIAITSKRQRDWDLPCDQRKCRAQCQMRRCLSLVDCSWAKPDTLCFAAFSLQQQTDDLAICGDQINFTVGTAIWRVRILYPRSKGNARPTNSYRLPFCLEFIKPPNPSKSEVQGSDVLPLSPLLYVSSFEFHSYIQNALEHLE